jgi:hypothetical protein
MGDGAPSLAILSPHGKPPRKRGICEVIKSTILHALSSSMVRCVHISFATIPHNLASHEPSLGQAFSLSHSHSLLLLPPIQHSLPTSFTINYSHTHTHSHFTPCHNARKTLSLRRRRHPDLRSLGWHQAKHRMLSTARSCPTVVRTSSRLTTLD